MVERMDYRSKVPSRQAKQTATGTNVEKPFSMQIFYSEHVAQRLFRQANPVVIQHR